MGGVGGGGVISAGFGGASGGAAAGQSAQGAGGGGANGGATQPGGGESPGDKPPEDRKDWVAIEVVDTDGKPVAMLRFKVTGPDGVEHTGLTDSKGAARVDGLTPGECTITFPDLHAGEWERA